MQKNLGAKGGKIRGGVSYKHLRQGKSYELNGKPEPGSETTEKGVYYAYFDGFEKNGDLVFITYDISRDPPREIFFIFKRNSNVIITEVDYIDPESTKNF
jgi:hypothetical protein